MAFSLESSFMSRKILFPINRISDPSLINYVIFCSFLFTFLKPGKYSLIRPYICYYLPYLTVVWFLASRCFTSRPRRPINAAPFCRSCGSWKVSAAIVVPVRHLRPIQIGSDHVDFLGRIFSPPPPHSPGWKKYLPYCFLQSWWWFCRLDCGGSQRPAAPAACNPPARRRRRGGDAFVESSLVLTYRRRVDF